MFIFGCIMAGINIGMILISTYLQNLSGLLFAIAGLLFAATIIVGA